MRDTSTLRRLGVLGASLALAVGASALTACSGGGGDLEWIAFGLETSVPDDGTDPSGTTPDTGGPGNTGVVVTTTEPEYSGEGAWLFITSSEVDPGANFSLQVVGFAPDTEVTIELRTSAGITTVLDTLTTDDKGERIAGYVLPKSTPEGDHRIVAIGTDPDGEPIEVGQRLTVDLSKPAIGGFSSSPSVVAVGNTVSVFIDVTDTYGVEKVTITTTAQNGSAATWCSGSATLVSGSDEDGRWRVNCDVPGTAPTTGYLVSATATDYSGNSVSRSSSSAVFSTSNGSDVTPPTISGVTLSTNTASAGDTITIAVRASDITGVDTVRVTVRTPSLSPAGWCDKYAPLYSGRSQDGTWRVSCTVPVGASGGAYAVEVVASDTAGNYSPSGVTRATFDVSGTSDTDPPVISNGSASPSSGSAGTSFTLSVDISDASGVANVYLSVAGGADISCGAASLSSGTSTNGTWTATCSVGGLVAAGSYSIEVNADDVASNFTYSATTVSFTVV